MFILIFQKQELQRLFGYTEMHKNAKDLTGQQVGRLLVICPTEKRRCGGVVWLCRCVCGNLIYVRSSCLVNKISKSCGCLQKEWAHTLGKTSAKHHGSTEQLYNVWRCMKQRCSYKNATGFQYYGGKGIRVCSEWKNDYTVFKRWALDTGYKPGLTVDRIDNDGNYEPSNCQWLTKSENATKAADKTRGKPRLLFRGRTWIVANGKRQWI